MTWIMLHLQALEEFLLQPTMPDSSCKKYLSVIETSGWIHIEEC